jgi:hypothetical protein
LQTEEPHESAWEKILCYVLPTDIDEGQKNFIRLQSHLRGTTEWDAYEKAKYLYKLWSDDGWAISRLEKQTKLSVKTIKENIEAYQLMEEQYLPKHGDDPNETTKFSYFVEYVKDKKLQKLMEKHSKGVSDFCEWVADKEMIPTGQDVRKLRDIFESDKSREKYINKGFDAAMRIIEVQKPDLVSSFFKDIANVTEGLKDINANEIDEIISEKNGEKERMIKELGKWTQKIIKMIDKK